MTALCGDCSDLHECRIGRGLMAKRRACRGMHGMLMLLEAGYHCRGSLPVTPGCTSTVRDCIVITVIWKNERGTRLHLGKASRFNAALS